MKCMFCGSENFDECNINVEGKIYGIVVRKSDKKKNKLRAFMCQNCGMFFFKSDNNK